MASDKGLMQTPPEPPPSENRRNVAFAEEELRLISALVLLLGLGLFLALPFVLSIGSVVFLPLVAAIMLSIMLSPLADRIAALGVPNTLASLLSVSVFIGSLVLALALILQPALAMLDSMQAMMDQLSHRFMELRSTFGWLNDFNHRLYELLGRSTRREVVLATPSMLEELAFATPSVVIEVLLTLLMSFFMIESRVRMRRKLLMEREDLGATVKAAQTLRDVQDRVGTYILTVTTINAALGLIVATGAWLLDLDAPIMWGGLAAILNFLPYVGPLVMIILLSLFGLATGDNFAIGIVPAACYFALHAVESNIITPSILGARFTMNPVMILISLSYFTWIWGFIGALLSVPILLTLTALVDHLGRPNLIGFIFGEPLFKPQKLDVDTPLLP